jgi:hypothetical protein
VLVGELDAGLRFLDGLSDQVHRSGTMTAFVGGGFLQRAERLMERRQGAFHIALIGIGRFCGRAEQADGRDARYSRSRKAAASEF